MFRKVCLSLLLALCATTVVHSTDKFGRVGRWIGAWYGLHAIDKQDISCAVYPKAHAYLNGLRDKYPVALGNVCIMMTCNEKLGPCCIGKTILFPCSWIQELEDGNVARLQQTEWIILHEAGHAHYGHSVTSGLLQCLPIGFMKNFMVLYVRLRAEPQADNFACQHCTNPEAMQAVIKFFQEEGANDLAHPSIKSRIAKIEKAIRAKS